LKHLTIHIEGKVQGVFFRASTKEKADELNIKGFVRNENDGSVYIEAEGGEDALKEFMTWCKSGPSRAIVQIINFREGELKNFSDFKIKH
jgi:acylphosphatase